MTAPSEELRRYLEEMEEIRKKEEEAKKKWEEVMEELRKELEKLSLEDIAKLRTERADLYAEMESYGIVSEVRARKVVSQFLRPDAFDVHTEEVDGRYLGVLIDMESITDFLTLARIVDKLSNEFGVLQDKFILAPGTVEGGPQRIDLGFTLEQKSG